MSEAIDYEVKTKLSVMDKKVGWALKKGNLFWGEIPPDEQHRAEYGWVTKQYGWTNNPHKISILEHVSKPEGYGYIANTGDAERIRLLSEGEWVQIECEVQTTIKVIEPR